MKKIILLLPILLFTNFSLHAQYVGGEGGGSTIVDQVGFASLDLPVNLISFNAQLEENKVLLKWETASEQNNDYFMIEYSSNKREWENIGKVEGSGNSNTILRYNFTDDKLRNKENYYRLKQVDFDGQFEYSTIIRVNSSKIESTLLAYPNPVITSLTVSADVDELETLQLFNSNGQEIKLGKSEGSSFYIYDFTVLEKGLYILKSKKATYKILKD